MCMCVHVYVDSLRALWLLMLALYAGLKLGSAPTSLEGVSENTCICVVPCLTFPCRVTGKAIGKAPWRGWRRQAGVC